MTHPRGKLHIKCVNFYSPFHLPEQEERGGGSYKQGETQEEQKKPLVAAS